MRLAPLRCQGCGREVPGDTPSPYRCPAAGTDSGDHVLARALPEGARETGSEASPFLRYRRRTHAYALARAKGMSDDAFVALVSELDEAVTRVAGTGFRSTPFARSAGLSDALGLNVWVKDETGNVSGSHKGRHLMGLAILGEVMARTGLAEGRGGLAIASCGNAALAAAFIARAWGRDLDVFIPPDANPNVVAKLEDLGAAITVCAREPGVPGDPCYLAFRAAVDRGAIPFCCQGPDNGLTVEGGETIAWEMADQLAASGARLDRIFVQVGGGAFASAVAQGLHEAKQLGVLTVEPQLHAVQTEGAWPLRRAWQRLADRLAAGRHDAETEISLAARNKRDFMWPWESEPKSIAHGILDDETYDWLAILRGMHETGGYACTASEETLARANALAREKTGIRVDPTGSAGLAGLVQMVEEGLVARGETVGVVFSGVLR